MQRTIILVCAIALTGCATGTTTPTTTTSQAATPAAQPASATATSSWQAQRPTAAELAAFVTAFRTSYPALAQGRKDRPIADDADNTCGDVFLGGDEVTIVKHVGMRFARDGGSVPPAQAKAIYRLVRAKACP
jgi:hypothetical protein